MNTPVSTSAPAQAPIPESAATLSPAHDLRTPLCDLLGCRYPIVQTAMGWVAGSSLVVATTNAGGFGFLAGATIAANEIENEIVRIREQTGDKPFGLNFHMFQPNAQQLLDLAVKHKLRAVSYGRGPDKKVIGRLRDAGIVCMPTVGALKHAQKAIEMGANAITIQGGEGGGHTGSVPTTVLLPQVVDAVDVPVIAAGGFYDGRGLLAALAFGAQGIATQAPAHCRQPGTAIQGPDRHDHAARHGRDVEGLSRRPQQRGADRDGRQRAHAAAALHDRRQAGRGRDVCRPGGGAHRQARFLRTGHQRHRGQGV